MDPYVPTTILLLLEGFRQYFPAQHFAYVRGDVWALAMLGTTRKGMTNVARTCVFVERHLASWERFLAESPWDLRGVSHALVTQLLQPLGGRLYLWDALLAAVETTLIPNVQGQRPGVQKWHDHRGDPAHGESLVGHHWALVGLVSTWSVGDLCWPVLARWLPGQLNPLGCVAGPDGIPRLDCWLVVVALVRELRQYVGAPPRRVVADAYFSQASCLNPLVAEGLQVISRRRQEAVGWDEPAPVVGQRRRGRPRKQGRVWKLATWRQVEPSTELTGLIDGQEERVQVVWRDVWWRDVTPTVRVVVVVTRRAPILLVSPDRRLPPAAIIALYAARFPMERSLRDVQPYLGLGDYPCQRVLASHRLVHLALTACGLWRLTRLQEQQAPWLTAATATPAGTFTPLSCQRLHRALRRLVWQRMFAASAVGADFQTPAVSDARIFRLAA